MTDRVPIADPASLPAGPSGMASSGAATEPTAEPDRAVVCPRCGAGFGCGVARPVDDPCWCGSVSLPPGTTDRLAVSYHGCLCPACLRAEAAGEPTGG